MINFVVPMAGRGSRFAETGELNPKPLIEVAPGKRMIEYVIDCLTLSEPHRFIFVCLEEHAREFDFDRFFRARTTDFELVIAKKVTRGPAATALLAERFLDNRSELLIAYCDSFLTVDPAVFLEHNRLRQADGALITYPSDTALDSYAEIDADGRVLHTAEKKIISPNATAGFYYFGEGRDYIASARGMIAAESNECAEFFVCPVYNEMIRRGKSVVSFSIDRDQQIEMGTPEDLANFRRRLVRHMPSQRHAAAPGW